MAAADKGDEYLFKVLVVGEVRTPCARGRRREASTHSSAPSQVAGGKTSLVRRYVYNNFSENYQTTIGALPVGSERTHAPAPLTQDSAQTRQGQHTTAPPRARAPRPCPARAPCPPSAMLWHGG